MSTAATVGAFPGEAHRGRLPMPETPVTITVLPANRLSGVMGILALLLAFVTALGSSARWRPYYRRIPW
jgi:hypothetical protein